MRKFNKKIKTLTLLLSMIISSVLIYSNNTFHVLADTIEYENNTEKNTIYFSELNVLSERVNSREWMTNHVSDDESIGDLSIPGTHDSTAYRTIFLHSAAKPWAVTQSKDITQQLNDGIRYFDFRTREDFKMYHGSVQVGTNLISHLNEITNFLKLHPREFIILRIKNENGNAYRLADSINKKILSNEHFKPYFVNYTDYNVKARDVRGKIILLNDVGVPLNISTPKWSHVYMQDDWRPSNFDVKFEEFDEFNKSIQKYSNLSVNHASFTFGTRSIWNTSKNMNERIYNYYSNNMIDLPKTGIVAMDYPTEKLINLILDKNKLSNLNRYEANPITINTGDNLTIETLCKHIKGLDRDKVHKIVFSRMPNSDSAKKLNLRSEVTFIDYSKRNCYIPIEIKDTKKNDNENKVAIFKFNAKNENNLGIKLKEFGVKGLRNYQENHDENSSIRNFFANYYDLSRIDNINEIDLNTLLEYAKSEYIEAKDIYLPWIGQLEDIFYKNNKLYIESYSEFGHCMVEISL